MAMPCSYLSKHYLIITVVIYTHKCLSTGLSLPGGLPPEDQCLVFQKVFSQPIENDIKRFFHQLQKDQIAEVESSISNGTKPKCCLGQVWAKLLTSSLAVLLCYKENTHHAHCHI